jgi:hypothetical protein
MGALTFLEQPAGCEFIDHRDGQTLNNDVFLNLRWCTRQQNNANMRSPARRPLDDGTVLPRNVYTLPNSSRYRMTMSFKNKVTTFGYYDTVAEAEAAAIAKRQELNGEFACDK